MKQAEPRNAGHREDLLHLWMGQAEEPPARTNPPPVPLVALLGVIGAIVVGLLAKYAIDALAILLALTAVGLVLHILGMRLAESDLLSPGWFLILVLAIALVAYALFVPADSVASLNRYMPRWVLAAIEWSENKGWAGRVLVGPGGGGTGPQSVGGGVGAAVNPTAGTNAASSVSGSGSAPAPTVILSASATTVLQGQPVTLMARLSEGPGDASGQSVRFYLGSSVLGTATVRAEGRARIAYLTVRGLSVGRHEMRAELAGPLAFASSTSEPLAVTVVRSGR